ncbi:coiled-coil domain-containing protein 97 isoform X1 [Rhagoletis pomonella]|uniref:coiled-coil domain-containing protein 97 isoform X1 n=2 Tax=Rhagoletis pomonella TaxID=28610 RepID=UPI001783CBD1|nr:coiled-coil domain-containing protein 97 isoform X1 [Rhagoletis pomonella]
MCNKMTAETIEPVDSGISNEYSTDAATHSTFTNAAAETRSHEQQGEIEDIFTFLSLNKQIVFKSQQIDDPELRQDEKVEIARDIYVKSPQTFLMRFGSYLKEHHLTSFAQIAITNEEHSDEMELLLADYRNKLHTRKRDVKNRRYAAMQQLIADGEYFSEQEMMKRAPELYQELVGQYLSEAEKKRRDGYDVKNTTFSGILMHTMEQKQLQDVLKLADKQNVKSMQLARELEGEDSVEDDTTQSTKCSADEEEIEEKERAPTEDDVPASFRQQWGNFDNEQVACSASPQTEIKSKQKTKQKQLASLIKKQNCDNFITAGERELLRQEFIGIMHEQFLSGGDEDFDYTQVDDNTQLDDLSQINQDKEDAYFEESDNSFEEEGIIKRESEEHIDDEESEDELDVFMNHLNRHHSLQRQ